MNELHDAAGQPSPLGALVARFGPRLSEMALEPGLVAAVMGFTDALRQIGWNEPAGHDFASLRLTAVCWLIREHGLDAA
jgi:hypothetical protein